MHDDTLVYPFMTIMMPVVMMADWIGNRDDMIHTFLEAIAPTIRRVAGNGAVPAKGIAEPIDEVARSSSVAEASPSTPLSSCTNLLPHACNTLHMHIQGRP